MQVVVHVSELWFQLRFTIENVHIHTLWDLRWANVAKRIHALVLRQQVQIEGRQLVKQLLLNVAILDHLVVAVRMEGDATDDRTHSGHSPISVPCRHGVIHERSVLIMEKLVELILVPDPDLLCVRDPLQGLFDSALSVEVVIFAVALIDRSTDDRREDQGLVVPRRRRSARALTTHRWEGKSRHIGVCMARSHPSADQLLERTQAAVRPRRHTLCRWIPARTRLLEGRHSLHLARAPPIFVPRITRWDVHALRCGTGRPVNAGPSCGRTTGSGCREPTLFYRQITLEELNFISVACHTG
mmetsp:Transcript_3251/g.7798  ORF Transcript_3251/g.7798 Transcript_3251/m.7798 type:complete len:300 (+) Transcript_3251:436-1335(+)